MNPVLPREHFVPDSEARVMPDGRLYVYGSYDISGAQRYCSDVLHVFSTDNLIDWVDHGIAFSTGDIPWANENALLYAPDCIYRDGKYHLYFCLSDNTEGTAVSDSPFGPFRNPEIIPIASSTGIDPAVFIDDDGKAYYYWGQFTLRAAEMKSDMKTLKEESIVNNLIDEKRFGFHEGASVRKCGNTYILLYTCILRGKATCLAHATARHPLGPFTYRGIVIDNIGTDPETWNNHGSIECFQGKWYVFYHKSSQRSCFSRRLCIEPIEISEAGFIKEVLPTTQGIESPLPANALLPASGACRLGGWGTSAFIAPDSEIGNEEVIKNAGGNGWAIFRTVNFDSPVNSVSVQYSSEAPGALEIWADDEIIAFLQIQNTHGAYKASSANVSFVSGVHTLYLEWKMPAGAMKIRSVRFHCE